MNRRACVSSRRACVSRSSYTFPLIFTFLTFSVFLSPASSNAPHHHNSEESYEAASSVHPAYSRPDDSDFLEGTKWTMPDGSIYFGNLKNGKKNGLGKLVWASGVTYEGEFRNDEMYGHGTKVWPTGEKYVGDFVDGVYHGKGRWSGKDGSRFNISPVLQPFLCATGLTIAAFHLAPLFCDMPN